MKNKNRAFSLIELSIVILIVGILIAGVTQGSRLVNASKTTTAQTLTQSSPVAGVSGLLLWLDATNNASFNSTVAVDAGSLDSQTWFDINPQATTNRINVIANASSGAKYKSVGINGLPSVAFAAGANGFASTTPLTSPYNAFTVFTVARSTNLTAANTIFYNGTVGSSNGFGVSLTSSNGYANVDVNNAAAAATGTTASILNAARITSVTIAPNSVSGAAVASPVINTYINGAADVANAATTAMALPTGGIYIGSRSATSTAPFLGDVSEIIIFNTVLKVADRQAIERYLGQKYGIPVTK